jgi:amino acid transporter
MENTKTIIFFVSLLGAFGGALFTKVTNPAQDYFNWIVMFAIIGVIVANLILLLIYEISKSFSQ